MWIRARAFGALLILALPVAARAQSPHALVPILTNQQSHSLPNQFGIPSGIAADDAGDFAFVGLRGYAVFYRKAGSPALTRVIQNGDEIPGLTGSRVNFVSTPLLMNANGVIAFRADVFTTNRATHVIMTFDGTTLHTLVTGADTAPGTGGAKFEHAMTLIDLNDNGDVLIGSTLVPLGSNVAALPTVFRIAAGGGVTRIAGPGDASPVTGGTFTAAFPTGLGASGQVLLNAVITGGSAVSGIFISESGTLRKIAATNDPNPVGGTFSQDFTTALQRINPSGLVMFVANNSLFQNTAIDGTTTAIALGSAAPAPMGGTFSAFTGLPAMSSSGDAVFFANVTGGAGVSGLFRYRVGTGAEDVAHLSQTAPGTAGKTFTALTQPSVNASGTISFQGSLSGGTNGLFQKPAGGSLALVSLTGDASPLGGTFFIAGFPTTTLSNGAVIARSHVLGSPTAHHGAFRWFGGATTLMSTADTLPDGANEIFRPTFLTGAGQYIGVDAQLAGGRELLAYYDPQTQNIDQVGIDGDPIFPLGGGILQFQAVNTVMPNAAGDIVVQASVFGGIGPFVFNAILVGGQTQPPTPIAFDGIQDDGGRTLTSLQLNNNGVRPISINATGTVVFTAVTSGQRGVWVNSTSTFNPKKTAVVGDLVSTGAAITSINAVHGGINEVGKVLFTANTAAGQGLFVVTPGSTPVKVAQVGDPAPGGGTFSGFGTTPNPGFNNVNQVAFVATVSGGTGGGVFLATPDGGGVYSTIDAIALNGVASPAGGTYVINVARPDVVLNDAGHVVFLSDLSGGSADSGIFAKRGPLASVVTLVVQGQAAAGTGSTFATFLHGTNGFVEETHQVSATGQVAFFGRLTPQGSAIGWWHVETDNSIQPIIVVPSSDAAFDGGTAAAAMSISNWLPGDRYPVWAPLVGAPHDGGLYMYVPVPGAATGAGANVTVTPVDGVTNTSINVTFANVSAPGVTTLTRSATGPPIPRGWYLAGFLAEYFNVSTTASFTGNVTLCLDISGVPLLSGDVFRLLHYESGAWHDVTTSVTPTQMCGVATSLSPFVPVLALNEPATNIVQNGTFGSGAANWQVFATDGTAQDNSYIQWSVNGGVFEYYRVPPPSGSNQAVVLQDIAVPFAAGSSIVSHFDLGNSSSVRKRISVLIHSTDFSDLSVCTFWIPPNTPMRPYAMRTHTTIAWTGASISFYAASAGDNGGVYQIDNVVMGPGHELTLERTDCVDPGQPGLLGSQSGPELLTNGDFSTGNLTGWTPFGTITAQVTAGVAQFIRPSNAPPSGVLLQTSNAAVAAGNVVTATFQLGNSSGVRKRVTVLLHDFTFGDLAACTFWLPAGQPLSSYSMRTYTTQAWSNATISFYPATTDALGWFELDNVSLKATPAFQTYGSDCQEPNDFSGLGTAPAPESVDMPLGYPAMSNWSAPPAAEWPMWTGLTAVDRRRLI
jgi:hypothetical protein